MQYRPDLEAAVAVVARYGDQGLRWGDGTIYRGLRLGSPTGGLTQPSRSGGTIRIYDRDDQLVRVVSSNAGRNILQKCSFELLPTGPGKFDLTLTERVDVEHDYRVDIHVWNSPKPWYSGFVQHLPNAGTTERSWAISGFGFFAMVEDSLVTGKWPAGTYPHQIAADLAKQLQADTGGRISIGPISATTQATQIFQVDSTGKVLQGTPVAYVNYTTAGNVQFLRTPFKDAMRVVTDLSGEYEWGVDENRQFFFREISQAVTDDSRWWAGRHLETYVPAEDSSKIKNRMYIKLGTQRHDLAADSPLFGTNFLELPLEDTESQQLYRVRTGIYSAAAALDPTDATRAAAVELARLARPIQKATVTGIDFAGQRISAQGQARITGRGGVPLTLRKVKITYTMQAASWKMDLQLGDLDRTPGSFLSLVNRAIAEAALVQQNTQNQASTA